MFYFSSVWASTANKNLARLRAVQNFAAWVGTGARKFDHITPTLKQLHWLPIAQQLKVRDAVTALKCLNGLARTHLSSKFTVRADVPSLDKETSLMCRYLEQLPASFPLYIEPVWL